MDFAFSAEQEALRAAARDFLAERVPLPKVAALADTDPGWDPAIWGALVGLGWLDADLGVLEHAVLLEEAGYALLPAPFFATVALAWPASDGRSRLTLAWAEPGLPAGLAEVDSPGTRVAGDGTVTGHKTLVPDAGWVDAFVVRCAGGALRLVPAAAATVRPLSTVDTTRRLAEVRFDRAPSEPVVAELATVRRRALALAAAESVGVARRALDIAAEHARSRTQFDRPIGSYQAVSHRVADTYTAVQLATSLAIWAAWCVTEDDPAADQACAAATSYAGPAAVRACETAIQVLGGIGMTWEHPIHRFYKRAQWLAAFDTGGRAQRADIAAALLG
ncbi:MAG TPA: acyl-CoA dehydrogenase family protein [Mycobacteriales bacterium]|nr:acyl-CoA dehydrogenase family protein [Mycobacteriales bacterium]